MEQITKILIGLFLIFASAKIMGEIFERLKQPALIGEILAGVILGPYVLGWIPASEIYEVLAEIGVIILLFYVGLETKVEDIMRVGGRSLLVAVLGVIFPFIFGYLYTLLVEHSTIEAMFIGAAMVATSVGITARVFADLKVINENFARIILGAAVIDDIIGLLVLAIVTGVGEGTFSYLKIGIILLEAIGFLIFLIFVGRRMVKRYAHRVSAMKTRNAPFSLAILLMLGLSALASYIDLAAIVGAFMAGMVLAEFNFEFNLTIKSESLYDFLVPFFFVILGSKVDISVFGKLDLLGAALIITLFAIMGKLLGCGLAVIDKGLKQSALVGTGMVPRGEVGMIIASIGLSMAAINVDLYSIVVFMVMATTLLTPPFLRKLILLERKTPET